MKIRFKTKDGFIAIKECPYIEPPVSVVMSPMFSWRCTPKGEQPKNFMEYRKYELIEYEDGIPTVSEV